MRSLFAFPADERVGVLFVHGVGSQGQSATVREFGEPLVEWLREWHASRDDPSWWDARRTTRVDGFRLLWSHLSYGTRADEPAGFAVHVPPFHIPSTTGILAPDRELPSQTWVVTEAWWASRLEAPPFATMARWLWHTHGDALDRLRRGVLEQLEAEPIDGRVPGWARKVEQISSLLLAAGYAGTAVIGFVPLLALLLVSRLPIPGAGPLVLRVVRSLLVDNAGDFYIFLYDEIQALHIRSAVVEAVTWLLDVARCDRVLVMGHSQGTVVALDALARGGLTPAHLSRVRRLVTVGAALNNAWAARRVDERIPRRIPRAPGTIPWLNVWAAYDYVASGPIHPDPTAPLLESLPVTNELNVVTDHGGYFSNHEEYTSRLVQEIDRTGQHSASRFYPGDEGRRRRALRRRLRVSVLVALRLVAMAGFGLALLVRYPVLGRAIELDGLASWSVASALPFVGGTLSAVTSALSGIGGAVVAAAEQLVPAWLGPAWSGALAVADAIPASVLALLVLGVPFGLVYALAISAFFVPWHRRESITSAQPAPWEEQTWRAVLRSSAVLGTVLAAALIVALLPPLSDVAGAISRAMGGS